MSKLADKWKRMSVDLHFSNYGARVPAEEVFDRLMNCNSEAETENLLGDLDVVVWYPFESMYWDQLKTSIESTALTAQRYAGVPA